MGITSVSTSLLVTNSASRGSSSGGGCDKTCDVIIASTVCGVFGSCLLLIGICYLVTICKARKQKQHIAMDIELSNIALAKLEDKIGHYLDANPHILDMPDRKIPDYVKEHGPELTPSELDNVINVIAARRVAIV